MFGRSFARSADVARARLRSLGSGWVPTQQDIDAAFSTSPAASMPPTATAESLEPWPDVEPRSRVRLRSEAARGLLVLAAVGVLAAVTLMLLNWPRGDAVPETATAPILPMASDSAIAGVTTSTSPASGVVVVDIAGEVRRPGVRELPAGSRVIDAIDAAGGLTHGANTTALNLARVLTDGEQVLVAGPMAAINAPEATPSSTAPTTGGAPLVSINTASLEQLDALPGIGPVLAQAIIDYRTQNGPFASIEQLLDVSGIGDVTFADLTGLVAL